jgi:hypothetical protein
MPELRGRYIDPHGVVHEDDGRGVLGDINGWHRVWMLCGKSLKEHPQLHKRDAPKGAPTTCLGCLAEKGT